MKNDKIVNAEYANLYREPSFISDIVSQALIWERLKIIDYKNNWYKVKQTDNYVSWIHESSLVEDSVCSVNDFDNQLLWYIVKDRIVKIKSHEHKTYKYLSFGSTIPIIKNVDGNFASTILPDGKKYVINKKDIIPFGEKYEFKTIINFAYNNLGAPYFWGGKSGFGYDCSGFVQSLYMFAKYSLPRDCKDQVVCKSLAKIKLKKINIGDLVYFFDEKDFNKVVHVGIMIDENQFIHSSGYVKIESLYNKDINFNINLYNRIYGFYRINY